MNVTITQRVWNVATTEKIWNVTIQQVVRQITTTTPVYVPAGSSASAYNLRGSDIVDGVLTLPNTSLTKQLLIAMDGGMLHEPDYTVEHKAAGTTVTFNNTTYPDSYLFVLAFT